MSYLELLFTHKPLATQNNRIAVESYQNLIRRSGKSRKTIANQALFGFFKLFPFLFDVLFWGLYPLKSHEKEAYFLYFPGFISFIRVRVAEGVATTPKE